MEDENSKILPQHSNIAIAEAEEIRNGFRRAALDENKGDFRLDQVYRMLQKLNEIVVEPNTPEYEMPWIIEGRKNRQMRSDTVDNRASSSVFTERKTAQGYFKVVGDSRVTGDIE